MKKTKLPFILLLLLVLFLALAGAACDGGFAAVSSLGSGVVGTDLCLWGKGNQLALQDALWDSLSLPRSDSSEGNFSPMGADQGDLVSPEGGWQVVTSHTYKVRVEDSFYNPVTKEFELYEVGFDLDVSLTGGHEFLVPPDDFSVPGPDDRFRIYMGKGADPQCTISNVINPGDLSNYSYTDVVTKSSSLSCPHAFKVEVEYKRDGVYQFVKLVVNLFAHELNAVNIIKRNTAGEERPERKLKNSRVTELGVHLFNAKIKATLECVKEVRERLYNFHWGPRAGQEARLLYRWQAWENGLSHTISWDPAGWESSNTEGLVTFTSGGGSEIVDLGSIKVPAPALYASLYQDTETWSVEKFFTFDDLEDFKGQIELQVVLPSGNPVDGPANSLYVQFWGGAALEGSWGSPQFTETQVDEEGKAVINFFGAEDGFEALTMTAYPKVQLDWRYTQVVDLPKYIVLDHSAPCFVSPNVHIRNTFYPLDEALLDVTVEVYDCDNPGQIINQSMPLAIRKENQYTNREVVMQGIHRAYVQIDPALPATRPLNARAVIQDHDRGARESKLTLGVALSAGSQPKPLHEARKNIRFSFVPLGVGAWESGPISYSRLEEQQEFIQKVFPAPISFDTTIPFPIPRRSGLLWGEESHNSYLKRIFRLLNRLQIIEEASGGSDLIVGLAPPGFLGASGLQQAGTFGMNWEFLGAVKGAVLIDPSQALKHHTLHEFIHTLGFKDVYPKENTGWRPMSANGHDGSGPVNNLERYSGGNYSYVVPYCEAIMYDHTNTPWPTQAEYNALLDYATVPVQGTAGQLGLMQASPAPLGEIGEVLLLSGEVNPGNKSVILDPVMPYHGAVDRGLEGNTYNRYVVQLVDAGGAVLEQGFFKSTTFEGVKTAYFLLSLPHHPDAAAIEIGEHNGWGTLDPSGCWGRYELTGSAPQVVLTGPQAGTLSGEFEIAWEASCQGGPLYSTIMARPEAGGSWRTIAMDLAHEAPGAFTYTVDAGGLPAGEGYRFKVIVSDGLRCGEALSQSQYTVDGYRTTPALELPQQEIEVSVTDGMNEAAVFLPLGNSGSEELTVQFVSASLPPWVAPELAERQIKILPGENRVERIPLLLPKEPGGDLQAALTLETNDPERETAAVQLRVKYVEALPAPELDWLLTSPAGLPGGEWPVETSITFTAYAAGARRGLEAAVTIESAGGALIADEFPLDPDPHCPGAYLFDRSLLEAEMGAGEYGVFIHLSDPVGGLEREGEGFDFTFTLYEPNSPPYFVEPAVYETDLGQKKVGDEITIPYQVVDPDGDEPTIIVSGPLADQGLELVETDGHSGEIRWRANQVGEFPIFLTVEDPSGARSEVMFRVKVEEKLVRFEIWPCSSNMSINTALGTATPSYGVSFRAYEPVPIKAVPARGYEFARWVLFSDNVTVANEYAAETTAVLTGDAELLAMFVEQQGNQTLGDLEIGDRVVDPTWEWEHRLGVCYSNRNRTGNPVPPGVTQAVTWVVAAKDHYNVEGGHPHVTLVAEDLIALHPFDDSTNRGDKWEFGSNHWGDSGLPNASYGLRPFLNSLDKEVYSYAGDGFYAAFSEKFRSGILNTALPNIHWAQGAPYTTNDHVFALSSTELGLSSHYTLGSVLPYFNLTQGSIAHMERVAAQLPGFAGSGLGGMEYEWYWTRQPESSSEYYLDAVFVSGSMAGSTAPTPSFGVRPALNLRADVPVSLGPTNGCYRLTGGAPGIPGGYGDLSGDGEVSVGDVILLLRSIARSTALTPEQIAAADVNGDGAVNVVDAVLIMRFCARLIDSFPVQS